MIPDHAVPIDPPQRSTTAASRAVSNIAMMRHLVRFATGGLRECFDSMRWFQNSVKC